MCRLLYACARCSSIPHHQRDSAQWLTLVRLRPRIPATVSAAGSGHERVAGGLPLRTIGRTLSTGLAGTEEAFMRVVCRVLFVFVVGMLCPALAMAQASITGVAKDASGAVLPGVTVEASSPELIEKVRTAVTDGSGQYRIIDLRPGTYTVTF